ncbi:unnamed protein product, partial [marine sediment metagenome]
ERISLWIQNIDADYVGVGGWRYDSGFYNQLNASGPDMPRIALTAGNKIRLGCTIIDTTHLEVWTEPAGGGTRTVYFLDASLWTDANGHWVIGGTFLDDPTNNRVGLFTRAFGAPSQTHCNKDNLTLQTPGGPAKLYSFSQGLLYDITPSGLDPGEEDTQIDGDASSGFYGAGKYGSGVYGVGQSTIGAVD